MVRKYERVRNIRCGRFGSTILVQAVKLCLSLCRSNLMRTVALLNSS